MARVLDGSLGGIFVLKEVRIIFDVCFLYTRIACQRELGYYSKKGQVRVYMESAKIIKELRESIGLTMPLKS